MEYEEFRDALLEQLRDFYGKDGKVSLGKVKENDAEEHDGLWITLAEDGSAAAPAMKVEELYKAYQKGELADMDECMEAVICLREQYAYHPGCLTPDNMAGTWNQKIHIEEGIPECSCFGNEPKR